MATLAKAPGPTWLRDSGLDRAALADEAKADADNEADYPGPDEEEQEDEEDAEEDEAPAQLLRHVFEDRCKDLKDPEITDVPANIKLLEDLRSATRSWLKAMHAHKVIENYAERMNNWQHLVTLPADLRKFIKRITQRLSTMTHFYFWNDREVKYFHFRCMEMKRKRNQYNVIVQQLIKDIEDEQERLCVEHNESTNKKRKLLCPAPKGGELRRCDVVVTR